MGHHIRNLHGKSWLSLQALQQRGAAMLMAMLVVVMVASVAAAAVWQQWTTFEVEKAERDRAQSVWLLNGALDWVRLVLILGIEQDQHVYYGQGWDNKLKESRLSTFLAVDQSDTAALEDDEEVMQAFLSGQVDDMHARYNLQNVLKNDGTPDQLAILQARRLFKELKIKNADQELARLVGKLQEVQSPIPDAILNGSGNLSDVEKKKPLRPFRLQQLSWFGLAQTTLDQLEACQCVSWIDADADQTKVNLNTAKDVVLASVLDLDASQVDQLKQERPFKTLAEVSQRVPDLKDKLNTVNNYVGVDSRYFVIVGSLRVNDVNVQQHAVVRVTNKRGRLSDLYDRQSKAVGDFVSGSSQEAITESNFAAKYLGASGASGD